MISTCPQAQRLGIKTRQPLGHAQNSLTSAAPGIVDVARIVLVETDDEARRSNRARLLQLCLEAIRGSLLAARRVDLDALATQFVAKHPLLEDGSPLSDRAPSACSNSPARKSRS
jgi:hypothetical protein